MTGNTNYNFLLFFFIVHIVQVYTNFLVWIDYLLTQLFVISRLKHITTRIEAVQLCWRRRSASNGPQSLNLTLQVYDFFFLNWGIISGVLMKCEQWYKQMDDSLITARAHPTAWPGIKLTMHTNLTLVDSQLFPLYSLWLMGSLHLLLGCFQLSLGDLQVLLDSLCTKQ